ncbi:hypothetical protein FNH04_43575 [Streptomyces phyllanthi]|uniref:Uncharacterized protein n=1 Tax=Streptomyces phyllanthi TaxID=1803180 RepID=A0A5N8WGH2_9ACTN|nr:hypothetical protein [Streptomyces phyllanthi]
MPFTAGDWCWGLACGRDPVSGRWRGWYGLRVRGEALWALGLHPEQPTAVVSGDSPPGWWHAAGERYATRWGA